MNGFDLFDCEIAHADYVHFSIESVTTASYITVERNIYIIVLSISPVFDSLPTVSQNVRMI